MKVFLILLCFIVGLTLAYDEEQDVESDPCPGCWSGVRGDEDEEEKEDEKECEWPWLVVCPDGVCRHPLMC